ncbi:MAG: type II toxin-antitoxin system RelE/ParE family toxin [Peptococcaceae bacterium]|jgi:mRNA interferase RelE/StbE|nr:type II toxin-antitoxin system RelE/ParE family toxin [Peptococcaceae bacterium]
MSGEHWEYEILFSPKSIRQIGALEKQTQKRIKQAVEKHLRSFPPKGDVIMLEDRDGEFRLRVGDWRITFRYRWDRHEVHVAEVRHRSKAYRKN